MQKVTIKCECCGKDFQTWPYRIKQNVRYCSRLCKCTASRGKVPQNRADLVGKVFGLLTVVAFEGTERGHTIWRCRCVCGQESTVRNGNLQSGSIRSCGCLHHIRGDRSPNWRRGYTINSNGYMHILLDDAERTKRYEAEHRLVMAKVLGRPLTSDEVVHHINRVKTDNRPENLVVLSREEHAALHAAEDRLFNRANQTAD
jgi:hypothetical protein